MVQLCQDIATKIRGFSKRKYGVLNSFGSIIEFPERSLVYLCLAFTLANHKAQMQSSEPIKSRSKNNQPDFTPDWTRKWREVFQPITKRSNVNPKQMQLTALNVKLLMTNKLISSLYKSDSNILQDTKNHVKSIHYPAERITVVRFANDLNYK